MAEDWRLGNQFWKLRTKHGADPKYSNPEDLLKSCYEYLEYCEQNPLYEDRPYAHKVKDENGVESVQVTHARVPKMRAPTIMGLCTFLGITTVTWYDWVKRREDLSNALAHVDQIIRDQKFVGAAAELLNPMIIARDLGLKDKGELTGADGKDLVPSHITVDSPPKTDTIEEWLRQKAVIDEAMKNVED